MAHRIECRSNVELLTGPGRCSLLSVLRWWTFKRKTVGVTGNAALQDTGQFSKCKRIRRHRFVVSTQSTKWSMQKGTRWLFPIEDSRKPRQGQTVKARGWIAFAPGQGKAGIRHSQSPDSNFDPTGSSTGLQKLTIQSNSSVKTVSDNSFNCRRINWNCNPFHPSTTLSSSAFTLKPYARKLPCRDSNNIVVRMHEGFVNRLHDFRRRLSAVRW